MKKEFLETGKIVGTHGVRGMVRIQPWSDSCEFLSDFNTLYLDSGKTSVKIKKIQPHGRIVIAQIDGIDTIEQAEALRNKTLYIKRNDARLPEGRYFIEELIGCRVFDADTNALLGTLTDVSPTGANDVWHITNEGTEYLVPAIDDVIVDINIDTETVIIRPLRGIFEDAD